MTKIIEKVMILTLGKVMTLISKLLRTRNNKMKRLIVQEMSVIRIRGLKNGLKRMKMIMM